MSDLRGRRRAEWRKSITSSAACSLLLVMALSPACGRSRAERWDDQARALAKGGHYVEAIAKLEKIVGSDPGSPQARLAKKQILLYEGLRDADLKKDRRQAKDEMLAISRALLDLQTEGHPYPATLEDLDSNNSLSLDDPWGEPYRYTLTADRKGYRLECLGKDERPGGEGDDQDLVIVNGAFLKDLPWLDR